MITRRHMTAITLATLVYPASAAPLGKTKAILYKDPECSCCDGYARYLRENGVDVTVVTTRNMAPIKKQHGVSEALESCHTVSIDGYAVEGHVPFGPVNRMLTERPNIKGIALPGMPAGSPGMSGRKQGPFTIFAIADGEPKIYARE